MTLPFGTGETVNLVIDATTYAGERWQFGPLMPWDSDNSSEADTYRTRNAGKTWECDFFGGIEYARSDRWKPPVIYNPGNVTIDATGFVRVPPQQSGSEGNDAGRDPTGINDGAYDWDGLGVSEGEDCHRLAIWRPTGTAPAGGWPTLVYFHGGGNDQNTYAHYQTWGHWLAAQGIMVINVEYRLGLFGYFWSADIEAEGDYAGPHFAHMDRVKALEWINTHASDLGIDTTKVCLHGSSAGGQAILYILADSSASGYFTRAWASSGGGGNHDFHKGDSWRGEGFKKKADRVLASLQSVGSSKGVSGNTYSSTASAGTWADALRDTPTRWVLLQQHEGFSSANQYPWVRESDFPLGNSYRRAKNGDFTNCPVIMNWAGNEASVIGANEYLDNVTGNPSVRCISVNQNWARLQRESPWIDWAENEQERMLYTYAVYGAPAFAITYELADQGRDAWAVMWNHVSIGNTSNDGAGHSSNLSYTFMNPQWQVSLSGSLEAKLYEVDMRVAQKMAIAMINFVANGDPSLDYSDRIDLGLWETPLTPWTFTKMDTTNQYVNFIGSEARLPNTTAEKSDDSITASNAYSSILDPFRQGLR